MNRWALFMKKFLLDILLLILFFAVMSFYFLPHVAHEIFGVVMFVAVGVHLYFNRRQIFSLNRRSWTRQKIFSTLIFFLLAVLFMIIFVSGVCMSNFIFKDFIPQEIQRNMTIHQIHVAMPYIFLMLVGLHIGIHWQEIFGRLSNILKINKKSMLYKISARILIFILICFGVYGSFLNRMGDRILMKHIFATPATSHSLGVFVFFIFSTMSIYVVVGKILNLVLTNSNDSRRK